MVFGQKETASPYQDVQLMGNVAIAIGAKIHQFWPLVHDGHHVGGIRSHQIGLAHQELQNDVRFGVFFQVDGDAKAALVGLVPDFLYSDHRLIVP